MVTLTTIIVKHDSRLEPAAVLRTIGAQPLGDREHHLSVRHGRQERGVQPLRPDRESLGVAPRAEVPALAGEGPQVFGRTGVAAEAREVVCEDTAREEPVSTCATTKRHGPYSRAKRSS
jgi:hypothetical protein